MRTDVETFYHYIIDLDGNTNEKKGIHQSGSLDLCKSMCMCIWLNVCVCVTVCVCVCVCKFENVYSNMFVQIVTKLIETANKQKNKKLINRKKVVYVWVGVEDGQK